MKKTLSIIMAICMLLGLTATMAYAGNGPSQSQSEPGLYDAYIGFFRVDEYGEVVRDESYRPESYYSFADNTAMGEMTGAVYDRPSNTLTITNFNKPDFLLEVNSMGDDFKLKVVGDCSLARIAVWGWDWGGSITITGDGKLVVNENSTMYPAIILYPEYSEGERLEIGPDVTVELYSAGGVIADNYSSAESAPFFFANAPEESLTISQYSEGGFIPTHISVYSGGPVNHGYQRTILASDPDGVYGSQPTTWWADYSAGIVDHEGYTVYRFIYVESLDAYIYDPTFGDEFTSSTPAEVELSTEEFEEAGFEIVTNGSDEPIWDTYTIAGDYMSSTLYTDGTDYYYSYYSWDEDAQEVTEQFFHITPIEGFENVYLAGELAEGITPDDVTLVGTYTASDGISTFRVTNTELHVGPGGEEPKFPFTDVKDGKWYTEAIKYVYYHGLMNGMTDTTFEPNSNMSRAMLVTVLWRAEGSPAPKGTTPFTDLKAKWYKDAVAWAYENSIVKGMSDTTFAPNNSITREQIAAIFYRYAEFKGEDVSKRADISKFPDGSKVSKYARDAMSWAVAEGLISGTKVGDKDYLDPKGNATRAQVATILMRYLESR